MNCPVCRDGFRNYYYRPLKCPHSAQKELHPELTSDDDDDDSVENWNDQYAKKTGWTLGRSGFRRSATAIIRAGAS